MQSIPLSKIYKRSVKRRGPINRYKNYNSKGWNGFVNLGDQNDQNNALQIVYTYLSRVGANPTFGPNGGILAKDPNNSGKMTTSIKKLRNWFDVNSVEGLDPVWNFVMNMNKTSKSYSSLYKLYNKYGSAAGIAEKKLYDRNRNYLRKGMMFNENPGLINAYAQKYKNAYGNQIIKLQNSYNSFDSQNRAAYDNFRSIYGNSLNQSVRNNNGNKFRNPNFGNSLDRTQILGDLNDTVILPSLNGSRVMMFE